MKSLFKSFVLLLTLLLVSASYVSATDVGGQILEDTTWTLAGSPYNIISDIQIYAGVDLVVEPKVVINGNGHSILVDGMFQAVGIKHSPIIINRITIIGNIQVLIETSSLSPLIKIEFSELYNCMIENSSFSSLFLLDSYLENMYTLKAYTGNLYIERNVFTGEESWIGGIELRGSGDGYIRNNIFYLKSLDFNSYASAINCYVGETANIIIEFNSFLNTNSFAIKYDNSIEGTNLKASNNYWGTTNKDIIDLMIQDEKDFPGMVRGYVNYEPFLTEPHPDTPILNGKPIANAGFEQVGFDELTLDGSASSDPNGTIVSYKWNLQNRITFENFEATGINPTVTGLTNGFYDVCLTVTDNEDAINTDCIVMAAAGSCGGTVDPPPPVVDPYMYVNSINLSTKAWFFRFYYGVAEVKVVDDLGNPVEGATVAGTFSGSYSETNAAITNSSGIAKITTSTRAKNPVFQFCVTGVTKDSLVYDSSKNVESCDSK